MTGDLLKGWCGCRMVGSTMGSIVGVGPLRRTGLSGAGEGTTVMGAKTVRTIVIDWNTRADT